MIPYLNKIITSNLIKEAYDDSVRQETLLPDEKCKECGRELIFRSSLKVGVCGVCAAKDRRLHKRYGNRCNLFSDDPDFNKGHGQRFFDAFDRALARGDFR